LLTARVEVLQSQTRELERQLIQAATLDQVQVASFREQLAATMADLERSQEQLEALTLRSPRAGVFIVPRREDLPGRFSRKGQLLAYVVDPTDHLTVRAVVSQDDIGLLRERMRHVDVLPNEWGARTFRAEVRRTVPGGTQQLPTAALGTAGGGPFAIDPREPDGRQTLARVFELELQLPEGAPARFLGNRVHVRFDHGYEPLGLQLYRSLRQLLLRQFNV
jgi:putative peptide zinc metalloprotease protein